MSQRAPVAIVYFAFRIMVGIAFLMLATVIVGLFLMRIERLERSVWYLRLCQVTTCLGFIAVIAGWMTTEVGRQPWTIYGLMRTADSVSPSLTPRDVVLSLIGYVLVLIVGFIAASVLFSVAQQVIAMLYPAIALTLVLAVVLITNIRLTKTELQELVYQLADGELRRRLEAQLKGEGWEINGSAVRFAITNNSPVNGARLVKGHHVRLR